MKFVQQTITPELYRSANADVLNIEAGKLLHALPSATEIQIVVADRNATPEKPVLYISGPMTNYPQSNYPAFDLAARCLRAQGWEVINPAEHFEGRRDLPLHKYMAEDVLALTFKCRGIVLLQAWEWSQGARLEAQIAVNRGYDLYVFYAPEQALMPVSREDVEAFL